MSLSNRIYARLYFDARRPQVCPLDLIWFFDVSLTWRSAMSDCIRLAVGELCRRRKVLWMRSSRARWSPASLTEGLFSCCVLPLTTQRTVCHLPPSLPCEPYFTRRRTRLLSCHLFREPWLVLFEVVCCHFTSQSQSCCATLFPSLLWIGWFADDWTRDWVWPWLNPIIIPCWLSLIHSLLSCLPLTHDIPAGLVIWCSRSSCTNQLHSNHSRLMRPSHWQCHLFHHVASAVIGLPVPTIVCYLMIINHSLLVGNHSHVKNGSVNFMLFLSHICKGINSRRTDVHTLTPYFLI